MKNAPFILVATWDEGLFCVDGTTVRQEIDVPCVRSVVDDGRGGALAIVGEHAVARRSAQGEWTTIATSPFRLASCVAVGDAIFAGTDDARMLRIDRAGTLDVLTGFDTVEGRDTWYAGTAVVDGMVVGPPLGIRSMSATCDARALFVSVHVGGIPRSTDAGTSWQPTIEVESDVHEVRTHPTRPGIVAAATAVGLCVSRDNGTTWTTQAQGLDAPHCAAVAFGRNDIFVSAASDPFASQAAVYRRAIGSDGPLQRVCGGMPQWTQGLADTNCIATRDAIVALVDRAGCLYVSSDDGATWTSTTLRLKSPSAVYVLIV